LLAKPHHFIILGSTFFFLSSKCFSTLKQKNERTFYFFFTAGKVLNTDGQFLMNCNNSYQSLVNDWL
jgi:hypothetical protein